MENGDFEVVTEGKGSIIFPKTNQVFYNKVQEFNRDMSVCVIGRFIEILKEEMKAKDDKFRPRLYKHKYGTEDPHPAVIGSEYHTLPVSRFGLSQVHPAVLSVNTRHLETTHPAALNREAYNVASSSYSSSICSPSALSSRNNNDNKFSFEGVRILEALSATGLRSMRYAKELPHVRELIVNDYSAPAVDTIRKNIAFNKLDFNIVRPSLGDGNMVMYQSMSGARFDVIDLDPYGTASIFLDSAVQAIAEGGLLAVTCTDKAVLCGKDSEACFAKYGSMSLRSKHCHEMAVRILLNAIEQRANCYKRYIVPLCSFSIDFYVRVFVRVYTSASMVKLSPSKRVLVYQCCGCPSFHFQPLGKATPTTPGNFKYTQPTGPPVDRKCDQCNTVFKLGGPIWHAPMHSQPFLERCLNHLDLHGDNYGTQTRMIGMMSTAKAELPDSPLHYTVASICQSVKVGAPKVTMFRSALLNAGYQVSQTHSCPDGLKTNAPNHVLFDILRAFARQNPPRNLHTASPGTTILAKEIGTPVNFSWHRDANVNDGIAKFLPNPEKNWGPKARAQPSNLTKRKLGPGSFEENKSRENQGKKKKRKLASEEKSGIRQKVEAVVDHSNEMDDEEMPEQDCEELGAVQSD